MKFIRRYVLPRCKCYLRGVLPHFYTLQGFAFGTGSAIAHRAVGAVAGAFSGSDDEKKEAAPASAAAAPAYAAPAAPARDAHCDPFQRDFVTCLREVRSSLP